MEKHRCKLCFKSFLNGRALGGHMRSHMFNLPIPSKTDHAPMNQLSHESEAASASYSSDEDEEEEEREEKGFLYGLRDNPKKSVRVVDPEFVDAGSVVVQDGESETESSKNPTRRRSKRARKILDRQQDDDEEHIKKVKLNINQLSKTESWVEPESVSSISDTTTEEDVAFCLMMLSRDQWKIKVHQDDDDEEDDEDEDEDDDDDEEEEEETDESEGYFKLSKVNNNNNNSNNRTTGRAKYRCETCSKVFKSYQALGGHRASHKKMKANYSPPAAAATHRAELKAQNVGTSSVAEKKIHQCPVCFRNFTSGQALGGHKRSHVTGQAVTTTTITTTKRTAVKSSKKLGDSLIDLNLPAPIDDDDVSQIEVSAVSDAEFVNHRHSKR